jgi:P27 family predicted phage terminase small subunit
MQRGRKSAASLSVLPVTETEPAAMRRSPERMPGPPPSHLSAEMSAWWGAVVSEHDLNAHRLHLLRLACEAYDRVQQARRVLAKQGLTFTDKNGDPRARPECAIERDSRTAFARLLRDLDLDLPTEKHIGGYPVLAPWQRNEPR